MSDNLLPKPYKSSPRKLARFFEQSRNNWKTKLRGSRRRVKALTRRVARLLNSRRRWKQRALAAEAKLRTGAVLAQAALPNHGAGGALGEGLSREAQALQEFQHPLARHHYSLGPVELFLACVLAAAVSLRGAAAVLALVWERLALAGNSPAWTTGRWWLLRLGYYKLTRPKPQGQDWIWIVDHTLQLGSVKCLLILGVRRQDLPPVGQALCHADVEPLALLPVAHSTGAVVAQQLEATLAQTGVPCEIIGDHGADLQAGMTKFQEAHPQTRMIYDIKHKTAAVVKQELTTDPQWPAFLAQVETTRAQVQQTALAALAPPSLRVKARYQNVAELIQWGYHMLYVLDHAAAPRYLGWKSAIVQAKIGWLRAFRDSLQEWGELMRIVTTTLCEVREQGLEQGSGARLARRLQGLAHTERARRVRKALLKFVAQEAAKAHPQERLLGSSEVIESVLGKLKQLEHEQVHSGFTGLVLGVCALVAPTTPAIIEQALEAVPTNQVIAWCQEHLGTSVQAKRKEVLSLAT